MLVCVCSCVDSRHALGRRWTLWITATNGSLSRADIACDYDLLPPCDILPTVRLFVASRDNDNREFWPAVRGSWVVSFVFCPLQFATFRFLPLEFRVLSVNVCDIAWTSVLSYFSHKAAPEKGSRSDGDGDAGKRTLADPERTKIMSADGRNRS